MRNLWYVWSALALVACTKGGTETDLDTDAVDETGDTDTTDTDAPRETCPDDVCVLTGTLTEDRTLHAYNRYVLSGGVFVGDDTHPTVLTVEPGTQIYGESSTGGMLVVNRGSQLIADGTAAAPIVFTSSLAPGERARGDWGGLILNGRAPINRCPEGGGLCEAEGEGGTGKYGGTDPSDSSGVLRHVVVEFGGFAITPDNELNGVAFQGVGSGTVVDYLQVHMGGDDGVEFFGGTVNVRHIAVTGVADDAVDWTDGWTGKAQFVLVQQHDDAGDNGIEADNQKTNKDASPRSNPMLDHVTLIGSPAGATSNHGMLLREGTDAQITNAIVLGFKTGCVDIDGDVTWGRADGGTLQVSRTIASCATAFVEDDDGRSVADWFTAQAGNQTVDPGLGAPHDPTSPDFKPTSSSPARSGGMSPADPFFEAASFVGAVDPAADWTTWLHTARN
jgi:hypothetical protein